MGYIRRDHEEVRPAGLLSEPGYPRHVPPPCPPGPWGSGVEQEGGKKEVEGARAPVPDKSLDRGLTFNRSQRVSCSATHETLTQNQVVYE